MIISTPDPLCALALGLTALLAIGGSRETRWPDVRPGASLPPWVPVTALTAFAAASSVLGVLHPDLVAAAFGAS